MEFKKINKRKRKAKPKANGFNRTRKYWVRFPKKKKFHVHLITKKVHKIIKKII